MLAQTDDQNNEETQPESRDKTIGEVVLSTCPPIDTAERRRGLPKPEHPQLIWPISTIGPSTPWIAFEGINALRGPRSSGKQIIIQLELDDRLEKIRTRIDSQFRHGCFDLQLAVKLGFEHISIPEARLRAQTLPYGIFTPRFYVKIPLKIESGRVETLRLALVPGMAPDSMFLGQCALQKLGMLPITAGFNDLIAQHGQIVDGLTNKAEKPTGTVRTIPGSIRQPGSYKESSTLISSIWDEGADIASVEFLDRCSADSPLPPSRCQTSDSLKQESIGSTRGDDGSNEAYQNHGGDSSLPVVDDDPHRRTSMCREWMEDVQAFGRHNDMLYLKSTVMANESVSYNTGSGSNGPATSAKPASGQLSGVRPQGMFDVDQVPENDMPGNSDSPNSATLEIFSSLSGHSSDNLERCAALQRQKLVDAIIENFCRWLGDKLLTLKNRGSASTLGTPTTSTAPSDGITSNASSSTVPSEQTGSGRGALRKRKQSQGDGKGSDQEDAPNRKMRKGVPHSGNPERRRFACPFYKRYPLKYRNSRTCAGPGWPEVHRVKCESL